ncbi:MAG TPA: preprotein translocase subunit SecE [Pirellulales bacterium]|jgi:preprotein translocase subunit SecE|nr:preprotein translocase subunit SecE [Pirellulales bacterium]
MAKEGNTALSPWRELFSLGVYKRSQGRLARQLTYAAIVVLVGFGCWSLHNYLASRMDTGARYGTSLGLLLVGIWLGFRLVNMPRFADFLIAVEAEMNKVSWPSRSELFRSVVVVLVSIIGLAIVLYLYDVLWQLLLRLLGVLGQRG